MDIQRNGNSIHIKAGNKDNNITVERKQNSTEVTIDGEKEIFKGNKEIVIDAGGGNDNVKVTNLASGKSGAPLISIIGGEGDDNIETKGNVKVIDNLGSNIIVNSKKDLKQSELEAKVNGYASEINTIISRKKPLLELKDKELVLELMNRSKDDGSLPALASKIDKDKKLVNLYRDMGTLVNQGNAGGAMSGVLALFTLGGSLLAEAKENKAYEMKDILKKANVPEAILKKLN